MGLQTYSMKERAALFGRLRNFGSVTSPESVAKHLSERGYRVSSAEPDGRSTIRRSLGSSVLEVGIENDAPTFHTANFAGVVLLLRDAIGDQATVCTGAGWSHWEWLCNSS
jgi:hypothetical protein